MFKVAYSELTAPCFLDQFIQCVGALCLDASAPANHSKEDCTHHKRLINHQEHAVAYIEVWQTIRCSDTQCFNHKLRSDRDQGWRVRAGGEGGPGVETIYKPVQMVCT